MGESDRTLEPKNINRTNEFKAFICCAESDQSSGEWLKEQLTMFRVPEALQKQGYPEWLGDIHLCVITEGMEALPEEQQVCLKSTEFLILLCSPAAVASTFMTETIDFFRQMGRGHQILTLLVDGPSSKSCPDVFISQRQSSAENRVVGHKQWSRISSSGADIRHRADVDEQRLKRNAVLRLTAKLLRCPYYRLYQHSAYQDNQKYVPVVKKKISKTDISIKNFEEELEELSQIHYRAFICSSLSETNKKDLLWLQKSLEGFKTPESLAKSGYPENLGRFYHDEKNEQDAVLAATTLSSLRNSDWLILVCCADTLNSKRVQKIVEAFFSWGRHDRVVALLTEGASSQVLPSLLRAVAGAHSIWYKTGVTSFDIRSSWDRTEEQVKVVAFQRLAAKLLQCRYYRLRTAMELDQNTQASKPEERVAYFGGLSRCWSIPDGYNPLEFELRQQKHTVYKSIFHDGRLTAIHCEDSRGLLKPDAEHEGAAIWSVEYRQDGSLRYVFVKRPDGSLIQREAYSKDRKIVDVDDPDQPLPYPGQVMKNRHLPIILRQPVARSHNRKSPSKKQITRYQLDYDDQGRVTHCYYINVKNNKPMKDMLGAYGVAYTVGDSGLPVASWMINRQGKPMRHLKFETKVIYERDSVGQLIRQRYEDVDGHLVLSQGGVAGFDREYDERGNVLLESFFDTKECVCETEFGYAQVKYHYDTKGSLLAKEFFDKNGVEVKPQEPVSKGFKSVFSFLFGKR